MLFLTPLQTQRDGTSPFSFVPLPFFFFTYARRVVSVHFCYPTEWLSTAISFCEANASRRQISRMITRRYKNAIVPSNRLYKYITTALAYTSLQKIIINNSVFTNLRYNSVCHKYCINQSSASFRFTRTMMSPGDRSGSTRKTHLFLSLSP